MSLFLSGMALLYLMKFRIAIRKLNKFSFRRTKQNFTSETVQNDGGTLEIKDEISVEKSNYTEYKWYFED